MQFFFISYTRRTRKLRTALSPNSSRPFHRLAEIPNIGHRRADLTSKDVLFYKVFSYLIIYSPRSKPLRILGVLHGKRNVARILRRRS